MSTDKFLEVESQNKANIIKEATGTALIRRSIGFNNAFITPDTEAATAQSTPEKSARKKPDAIFAKEYPTAFQNSGVFINTKKEKDVMKCIERICQYVAFDNSQVEELKQKE